MGDVEINFKWYKPSVGTPIVSVAEYGITFNRAAAEELGNPERIQIGFDTDLKLIGVRPVNNTGEKEDDSFPFAGRERNGFTRVNSKDFIRFITRFCPELKLDRAIRCLARWDEQLGVLIVDLNNPVEGQSPDGED